jgi:hypothetical protein
MGKNQVLFHLRQVVILELMKVGIQGIPVEDRYQRQQFSR